MIFLVISCSNEENTILLDQISDYKLKIVELEDDLKRIQKQLDNLCY